MHGLSCDEALVDMTMACFNASPAENGKKVNTMKDQAEILAKKLRASIAVRTGCNASIGIGSNRILARVALARAKPDSFFHLTGTSIELREMLDSLPVSQLPQVIWSVYIYILYVSYSSFGLFICGNIGWAVHKEKAWWCHRN